MFIKKTMKNFLRNIRYRLMMTALKIMTAPKISLITHGLIRRLANLLPRYHGGGGGGGGGGAAGEIKKREEIKIEHVRTIDFSSSILVYKNNKRNSTSQ